MKDIEIKDISDVEESNPILDERNPYSVINLVPTALEARIRAIPPEVFEMSIADLEAKARATLVERKLRISFWLEYERASRTAGKINISSVFRGICSASYFMKHATTNSFKLALMLTPPEDYKMKMEEMLDFALDEERKILDLPLESEMTYVTKDGREITNKKIDANLALVKHKIRESLQARLQGSAVHRSMQITENINRNYSGGSESGAPGLPSLQDLMKLDNDKLKEIVDSAARPALDVTPKKSE